LFKREHYFSIFIIVQEKHKMSEFCISAKTNGRAKKGTENGFLVQIGKFNSGRANEGRLDFNEAK
jgi:hypothetical protein